MFYKTLGRTEIFSENRNKEKMAIKTVINGLKLADHAGQALNKYRKKNFLAGVGEEYKDLPKYAKDSNTHLFGDDLGDSLKKAKIDHFARNALKNWKSNKRKFEDPKKREVGQEDRVEKRVQQQQLRIQQQPTKEVQAKPSQALQTAVTPKNHENKKGLTKTLTERLKTW